MAGYHRDEAVRAILRRRLDIVSDFARQGGYDIYVDEHTHPGIPRPFRGGRMAIEAGRRSVRALEIEATFWVLKIKRLAGL